MFPPPRFQKRNLLHAINNCRYINLSWTNRCILATKRAECCQVNTNWVYLPCVILVVALLLRNKIQLWVCFTSQVHRNNNSAQLQQPTLEVQSSNREDIKIIVVSFSRILFWFVCWKILRCNFVMCLILNSEWFWIFHCLYWDLI